MLLLLSEHWVVSLDLQRPASSTLHRLRDSPHTSSGESRNLGKVFKPISVDSILALHVQSLFQGLVACLLAVFLFKILGLEILKSEFPSRFRACPDTLGKPNIFENRE